MKFQLKALVAALALVAAVPASAAIDNAVTGNSSMVLTVWDSVANISASFDLGKNYSDFSIAPTASFANSGVNTAGTAFSWDITTGDYAAAWSSFTSLADEANAFWAVTAVDNIGNPAGARGLITTYTGAPLANMSSTTLIQAVAAYDIFLNNQAFTNGIQNHTTTLNGASTATPGSAAYFSQAYTSNRINNVGPVTGGKIDTSLGLIQTVTQSTTAVNNNIYSNANGISTFTLTSNGQLSYAAAVAVAPVPEPETYAMLLAGLGFMGFVARRKQAK